MARHRKHTDSERQSSKVPKYDTFRSKETAKPKESNKLQYGVCLVVIIGVLVFGSYNYYRRYLELRISTPLDVPRV